MLQLTLAQLALIFLYMKSQGYIPFSTCNFTLNWVSLSSGSWIGRLRLMDIWRISLEFSGPFFLTKEEASNSIRYSPLFKGIICFLLKWLSSCCLNTLFFPCTNSFSTLWILWLLFLTTCTRWLCLYTKYRNFHHSGHIGGIFINYRGLKLNMIK